MRRTAQAGRSNERNDAFAKIVASMGDPEWRRERRVVLTTTAAVLAAACAAFLLLAAPVEVLGAFVAAFVVGIVVDLAFLHRRFRRRQ